MPLSIACRLETLTTAALLALSLSIMPALANGDIEPSASPPKSDSDGKAPAKKDDDKRSQEDHQRYVDAYKAARALLLDGKYEDGLNAFLALGHDNDVEVATYVGYAYRKLGNYELSKVWYDRALAADPNHVVTWEYYGLWHLEQGNKRKAMEFLYKISVLCGNTSCQEFVDLKNAINSDRRGY